MTDPIILLSRFMAYVAVDRDSGCWIWTRHPNKQGYGQVHFDGKTYGAHKWLFEQLMYKVPDGLVLDHLCFVRRCVNPLHLDPKTIADNVTRHAPGFQAPRKPKPVVMEIDEFLSI